MSVFKEFSDFIKKGNVVDLAVAVVVGGAFGKIVSAVVSDLVMPLVNALVPQGDWRKWEVSPLHFRVGDFLGTVVDFVIVAFVIFLVMVKLVGAAARRAAIAAPPSATKPCPECLETVPAKAKRCRACTSVLTALALLLVAGTASAQSEPKFAFAKPEEVKAAAPAVPPVEWKAQVKGGVILSSGNSDATNGVLGVTTSRKQGDNRVALEGGIAYGKSNVLTPVYDPTVVPPAPPSIMSLDRRSVVSTNNWIGKGRYDRFFTTNNSAYASAQIASDKIAGKALAGGGQVGYSRQVLKTDHNLVVAELGYDYSHESYVQQPGKTLEPISIHSARIFAGETLKVTDQTGVVASIEALLNLNNEAKAINVNTNMPGVDPFHDTRLIGKLGCSTTVRKSLSVAFGFTVRYDQNPAPLPVPPGSAAGAAYAPTFQPFADKTDTATELTLTYAFL